MKIYHKDIKLNIDENIYEPREDSFLLAEVLEKELKVKKYENILEIGCGSGLLSIIAARYSKVTSVDINEKAVEITKKNMKLNKVSLLVKKSDLFDNITGKFDLIVFNPPYLPDNDNIKGSEIWSENGVINRFLKNVNKFLNKDGKILIVVSSLTGMKYIEDLTRKYGFSFKKVKTEKVPWEELIVLEIK